MTSRSAILLVLLALGSACGGGGGDGASAAALGDRTASGSRSGGSGQADVTVLTAADGQKAAIVRDAFGTPHVFGPTDQALFEAYGWAVAQDRLFQLELNRRAARGTLAAAFGSAYVDADKYARTVGYTDDELDGMYAALPAADRAVYQAYADGINRYLTEVIQKDTTQLPYEFAALGFLPAPWTLRDSMAFGAYMVRRFGEIGGREPQNAALLQALTAAHGAPAGAAMFDDVRFLEDPDAPVTVPEQAFGRRQQPGPWEGGQGDWKGDGRDEAKALWQALGVPTKLGSYAWVISAARSAEGVPLLYGGPQMGASAPEVVHEVQLTGGRGFDVIGMAFAGVPAVLIGRNAHVAWTSTTATGDNLDHYLETLCDAGAGAGTGTTFKGACRPFDSRVEHIAVAGGATVDLTVLRTIHGPVVSQVSDTMVLSQKRAHWLRELEAGTAFFEFDRAKNLNQFEVGVRRVVTSHNFLYVDRTGNIAYWQAGQVPVRPAGFDTRLPLPGDGTAEWPGGILPMPTSINPPRGWLANWNNKPAAGYPAADEQIFGKQGRVLEVFRRLEDDPSVTLATMRDIPKDIARVQSNGRDSRFLLPYLMEALVGAPSTSPLAGEAEAILATWDQDVIPDAVTSTQVEAGEVIFDAWLSRALANTFGDGLGTNLGEASSNLLIHVLDQAATGHGAVPPKFDWLAGRDWKAVLSQSFDEALGGLSTAQGTDPSAWTADRGLTKYVHPVIGQVGAVPRSNRATYAQIEVARHGGFEGESIFSLGQSGFIGVGAGSPPAPVLAPHFEDQLPLYTKFEYKPQVLLKRSAAGGACQHDACGQDDDQGEDDDGQGEDHDD